jgi:hypothetical protein
MPGSRESCGVKGKGGKPLSAPRTPWATPRGKVPSGKRPPEPEGGCRTPRRRIVCSPKASWQSAKGLKVGGLRGEASSAMVSLGMPKLESGEPN